MTGPVAWLPLGRQKFCVGRWIGMVALSEVPRVRADLGEAKDPRTEPAERKLKHEREAITAAVESATSAALGDEEEELEEFLERLGAAVRMNVPPGLANGPHVEELERQVRAYLADPIDPFEQVFERALAVARRLYAEEDLDAELPRVGFKLTVDDGPTPPHGRPALKANLEKIEGDADEVLVRVVLFAAELWEPEICALTYVILHELVVHGFAAPHARADVDAFAEGWMDLVAFELHEQLKLGALTERSPFERHFSGARQGNFACRMHETKADGPLSESGRIGAEAARDALTLRLGSEEAARAAMWSFSTALNRSPVDPSSRADLCERLARGIGGTELRARFVAAAAQAQAVSEGRAKIEAASRLFKEKGG